MGQFVTVIESDSKVTGNSSDLRRFALGLEYDGTNYSGWQIQNHASSIQQRLNEAVSTVANEPVACTAAGRTDAGVHATGQAVHFDAHAERQPYAWVLGINSNLPDDINVLWVKEVPSDFHARYSATGRTYRYVILNRKVRSALLRHRAWWVPQPLDVDLMATAAAHLIGKPDFSSFRAASCQSKSPVREIRRLDTERLDEQIIIECEANAFLQHMVRNIVGSLVEVGRGNEAPDWLRRLLQARDRRLAGMKAPPEGLFLTGVKYSSERARQDLSPQGGSDFFG